ncbi:MAG: aminomethyl-transferring glycine dehydrogenase subunit GcvPA [Deltaproteobacteria bacterium]|nr:aminomethyl-transferring glycine dehydrogenase subunit GcvPA [Deltaproteobacteria bacterium]
MSYVPHTPAELGAMLSRVGASSPDALLESVPAGLRSRAELKLSPALDERNLLRHFGARAAENRTVESGPSFLGAGAYHHFIPAAVDALASRGEFMTAYTPYQAEISQGTLQMIFEFQTLICQLTGMDVANASIYDGASSLAEAALMAARVTRRTRICVSAGLHPHWREVLRTYTEGIGLTLSTLDLDESGRTATRPLPADTAAVIVQSPNFFGCIEDLAEASEAAHAVGALAIAASAEALSLALLRPPGELGCDIACGEAQSFGLPLSFGGPYAGFLAAREKFVRQLPGRLIGESVDSIGQRAFVMTLTTREQHIRREKATSNICTNQGLCALRVAIWLAAVGKAGIRRLAGINLSLSTYARRACAEAGLALPFAAPVFNEFVVAVPDLPRKLDALAARGVQAGLPLAGRGAQARGDRLLVCTTEMNTRAEIDALVRGLAA